MEIRDADMYCTCSICVYVLNQVLSCTPAVSHAYIDNELLSEHTRDEEMDMGYCQGIPNKET